jgi:hypothetical protein
MNGLKPARGILLSVLLGTILWIFLVIGTCQARAATNPPVQRAMAHFSNASPLIRAANNRYVRCLKRNSNVLWTLSDPNQGIVYAEYENGWSLLEWNEGVTIAFTTWQKLTERQVNAEDHCVQVAAHYAENLYGPKPDPQPRR